MKYERLLIFGNTGSGKTYLAQALSRQHKIPLISLDEIYWRDDSYLRARSSKWASRRVRELSVTDIWVIEGIYSHLLKLAVPHATAIIWLDMHYDECIENIRNRGVVSNQNTLTRVQQYYMRNTGSSRRSHNDIFRAYGQDKLRIYSKNELTELMQKQIEKC